MPTRTSASTPRSVGRTFIRVGPTCGGSRRSTGYDATAERLAEAQAAFSAAPSPDEGNVPASTPGAAPRLTLHDTLVALRAHLHTISEPLRRDAVRDTQLARLGQVVHLSLPVMREHLAALDAPHRQVRAQIVRPGPALRDALAAAAPQALVPGYVYVDQQHVLYGAPQSLKTFTALDLGLHIASGLPWLGRIPVMQRRVVCGARHLRRAGGDVALRARRCGPDARKGRRRSAGRHQSRRGGGGGLQRPRRAAGPRQHDANRRRGGTFYHRDR